MSLLPTAQGLQVVTTMLNNAFGDDAVIQWEFGDRRQELPVKKVYISLGVNKTDVNFQESRQNGSTLVRKLTLEALVITPKTYDGANFSHILDTMLDGIYAGLQYYTLYRFESGPVKYSTSLGALVMPVYITISF